MENKNILFYGPGNTIDKKNLNINDYDYVIITNNMINIFFDKYKNFTSKIILYTNALYTKNYLNIIELYDKHIDTYIVVNEESKNILNKFNKNIIVSINDNKIIPLGLTRCLNILSNIKFKSLYITGVTFYKNKNLKECYENNYIVKEGLFYNIFNRDSKVHNIYFDFLYTKKICQRANVKMCPELISIMRNTK
jgi:hypothetical protein